MIITLDLQFLTAGYASYIVHIAFFLQSFQEALECPHA